MTRSTQQTRHDARPRGVTVTPLDFTEEEAKALTWWKEQHPDSEWTEARTEKGWALAVAPDGTEYLVCEEGVGWAVEDTNEFDVWFSTEHSFGMFPQVQVTLTREELHALPTLPPVDLADHVRVFGARLEDNFRSWYHRLSKGA